jgi:hypothetical protein
MNQHRFMGNRKQSKGEVTEPWSELLIDPAPGTRDQLADRVPEPHGISDEEAARQLDGFLDRNRRWDLSQR